MFPVCYIPAFLLRFREKQKDKLLGILGVISIVFGIYCFIGFPSVLAKITLLSFSFDKRTMVILEFVGMLMMFRAISKLENQCRCGQQLYCQWRQEVFLREDAIGLIRTIFRNGR